MDIPSYQDEDDDPDITYPPNATNIMDQPPQAAQTNGTAPSQGTPETNPPTITADEDTSFPHSSEKNTRETTTTAINRQHTADGLAVMMENHFATHLQ